MLEVLQNAIENHLDLKELYLFANKIDESGAEYISKIIKNKHKLTSLGLSNNKLATAGAVEIAKEGLQGKTEMTKISMENNVIGN